MRQKAVPEKKRSWLGNFGTGVGSGAKMVEKALKKVVEKASKSPKKQKVVAPEPKNDVEFKNVKEIKKRPHRYKAGTVALREIKRAQSNNGMNGASVASLDVIIRDIASKVETTTSKSGETMRFQPKALAALRDAAEQFYTDTLRLGNTLSIHRGKKTLQTKDFRLASSLMLAPHVLQEQHGSKRLLSGVLNVMRRSDTDDAVGNERRTIKGRSDPTTSEKVQTLRKYTQETGYGAVSDPPGIDKEEQDAEEMIANEEDADADPDSDAEADSDADDDEMGEK